ncbi:hypothetical protein BHE74_00019100 [Ensete ventricosum]|nr:hypothetical protein GW17_00019307 [Ensete ventricosum]RWW73044.1 hypothetical protein BHE74_00019100 [Ensete ventricosum]
MRASDGRTWIPLRGPRPPTRVISAPSSLQLPRYRRLFLDLCALIGGVELKGFSFYLVPHPSPLLPSPHTPTPALTSGWGS